MPSSPRERSRPPRPLRAALVGEA